MPTEGPSNEYPELDGGLSAPLQPPEESNNGD